MSNPHSPLQTGISARALSSAPDAGLRNKASALQMGLEILDLLATVSAPMTVMEIMAALDHSSEELSRSLQVLEICGYVEQQGAAGRYFLTDKLYLPGVHKPRFAVLLDTAMPVMRVLAATVGHSCHIAVHCAGEVMVAGQIDCSEQLGISVRVGCRCPLTESASGAVLYAFQQTDIRLRWERLHQYRFRGPFPEAWRQRADFIRRGGIHLAANPQAQGVTDICAPILKRGVAAAVLTVPFIERVGRAVRRDEVARRLEDAAHEISDRLVERHARI